MKFNVKDVVCPFCGMIGDYTLRHSIDCLRMDHHVADNNAEFVGIKCTACKADFHIEYQVQVIVIPHRKLYSFLIQNVYGKKIPDGEGRFTLPNDGVGLWPGVGSNIKDTWPKWESCEEDEISIDELRYLNDRRLI